MARCMASAHVLMPVNYRYCCDDTACPAMCRVDVDTNGCVCLLVLMIQHISRQLYF